MRAQSEIRPGLQGRLGDDSQASDAASGLVSVVCRSTARLPLPIRLLVEFSNRDHVNYDETRSVSMNM